VPSQLLADPGRRMAQLGNKRMRQAVKVQDAPLFVRVVYARRSTAICSFCSSINFDPRAINTVSLGPVACGSRPTLKSESVYSLCCPVR
jgi:hypothetical protein